MLPMTFFARGGASLNDPSRLVGQERKTEKLAFRVVRYLSLAAKN